MKRPAKAANAARQVRACASRPSTRAARQLWELIALETGLLGAVAGLLSMPTGYLLALILVYIINRRSFGWTLQMQVLPAPFLQALIVAEVAALLAGIYPAARMSRISEADAMRFD